MYFIFEKNIVYNVLYLKKFYFFQKDSNTKKNYLLYFFISKSIAFKSFKILFNFNNISLIFFFN